MSKVELKQMNVKTQDGSTPAISIVLLQSFLVQHFISPINMLEPSQFHQGIDIQNSKIFRGISMTSYIYEILLIVT